MCANDISQFITHQKPLYQVDGKKIFYEDMCEYLHDSNIKIGDVVMLHSNVINCGRPDLDSFDSFLEAIVRIFLDAIGPSGTLVMPTFTWSFTKNEIFDKQLSKSKCGVLSEYFRLRKGSSRTLDPLHSCAIFGPQTETLSNIDNDTFGTNSINRHLFDQDAKLVTFGTPFRSTLYHYAEQLHDVPYRYFKTFVGVTANKGMQSASDCIFFVRYLDRNIRTNTTPFENRRIMDNLMTKISVGNNHITTINARTLVGEVIKELQEDVYCLLDNEFRNSAVKS